MTPLFDDLVVLELASVLAGPSVGQFFAELGATVLKVENPATEGDVTRRWKLPSEDPDTDRSAYFAAANWGKQSLAIDLTTDDGQRVLHDLARHADVVVASYKPGDTERLGADSATLCALNPRLIYAHVVGYDADDPRAGYDAVIQAESGFTAMNGEADAPPLKMPVALIDVLAAHQLKEAVLVRLLERERTGRGGPITVSLLQSGVAALVNQATNWLTAGHVPQRMGSEHPNIAPYGTVFPTADGDAVVLAVGTDRQFAALCEVLGLDDLAASPQFATNQKRVRHRPFLNHLLGERIAQRARDELLVALATRNVPAGAVNDLPAVFAQPAARAMVVRDEAGAQAGVRHVAFRLDDGEPSPVPAPPSYAAHTRGILTGRLGYSSDEVDRLLRSGVVE
jgi:crotonobetainyl-CoA:carnitine CoA-transferase CaiB-like acyl-CoA transferase